MLRISSILLLSVLLLETICCCTAHKNYTKIMDPTDCVPTLSCAQCTQLTGCGYCFMDGACAPGDGNGAHSGACHAYPPIPSSQWDWKGTSCTNPPSPYKPTIPPPINYTIPFNGEICDLNKKLIFAGYQYGLDQIVWWSNQGYASSFPTPFSFLNSSVNASLWLSPCGLMDSSYSFACGKEDDMIPAYVCMEQFNPTAAIVVGSAIPQLQTKSTWSMIDPSNPWLGVRLTLNNGANSLYTTWSCPHSPTIQIDFQCDPWSTEIFTKVTAQQIDPCTFRGTFLLQDGCATYVGMDGDSSME